MDELETNEKSEKEVIIYLKRNTTNNICEMMKRVFNTNGNLKLYWTTELSAKPVEETYKIITKKIITDCQVY